MQLIIKQSHENGEQSVQQQTKQETINDVDNLPSLHLLPCKIYSKKRTSNSSTLTAPVDRYFCPYTRSPKMTVSTTDNVVNNQNNSAENMSWYATLRGKPLTGEKIDIPNGYIGVLCSKSEVKLSKSEDVNLIADVNDSVTQLMYWNWDKIPTREDPLLAALDWISVSEAIMTNND